MKSLSTDGGAHSPDEGLNAGRVGEGAEQRVGGGQHIKSYIFYDDLDLCADEKLFDITLCSSV